MEYLCRISYSFYYGKKISICCGFSEKGFLPISKQLITVDQRIFSIISPVHLLCSNQVDKEDQENSLIGIIVLNVQEYACI